MNLNSKKYREMWINFMFNPNIMRRDIDVNGLHIENVDLYK